MKKFVLLGVLLLAAIGLAAQDLSPEATGREYETLAAEADGYINAGNYAAAIPCSKRCMS
jgi:hypothetical protein